VSYYYSTTVDGAFADVIAAVTDSLKTEGFGVLTEIDVRATMKKKLDIDFRPYVILGACNPPFAYKALSVEDKIGVMLPCNVVVQELSPGRIEVSAVDPVASMQAVGSDDLESIAGEVAAKLRRAIDTVGTVPGGHE
jgi:uncharacterized protein (DUF302 family)